MTSQSYSTIIYENEIPSFAESELKRLYSCLYSTLPQLLVNAPAEINTYVASEYGEMKSLLLFEIRGSVIRILNEGIRIDNEEIRRFSKYVFERYPSVKRISLHAVDGMLGKDMLPCQQYIVLEDIVLAIPDSADAYLSSLGKSTRSYINRYLNRIRREHPTFKCEVYINDEFDKNDIIELIDIHRQRMSSKEKISIIDDKRIEQIFDLLRIMGLVVIVRIDGKVCAGTINYQVGDHYFLETVAHNPAFNDYRIGTICSYLTICECIARAGKEYHFLWGEYDYKYRLGGIKRELSDLFIYRSRAHYFLNSAFFLKVASKNRIHQIKKRLQHTANQPQNTLASRVAANVLHMLQKGKHILTPSS